MYSIFGYVTAVSFRMYCMIYCDFMSCFLNTRRRVLDNMGLIGVHWTFLLFNVVPFTLLQER